MASSTNICDESHYLQGGSTKRTQVGWGLGKTCRVWSRLVYGSMRYDKIYVLETTPHLAAAPLCVPLQFVSKLVKAARHALLLTGTPLLSKPMELFPQV